MQESAIKEKAPLIESAPEIDKRTGADNDRIADFFQRGSNQRITIA